MTAFNGPGDTQFNLPIEVSDLVATNGQVINQPVNVYGVPWIVGAKKGFPNFNELAMDTAFQITRKMEVVRPSPTALASQYLFYQLYVLNITNMQVGVECWNSYANAYTNSVMIYVTDTLRQVILTNTDNAANDKGFINNLTFTPIQTAYPVATWPGYNQYQSTPSSFQIPLNTGVMVITNSIYRFNQGSTPYLTPDLGGGDLGEIYETNVTGYPQPHWGLNVTNDLRVIMVDTTVVPNRVIDYVELSGPNSARDLTAEIIGQYDTDANANDLWDPTFQASGVPVGLAKQVQISIGILTPNATSGIWQNGASSKQPDEIAGFNNFLAGGGTSNAMQLPYTPTATVVQHISWQANDPLVHYLANDLNWAEAVYSNTMPASLTSENLGMVNLRYAPWGNTLLAGTDQVDQNKYNLAYKDPLVASSDNWDFPSYKLPTAGWLGRVHRGTPWQTVYLKSTNVLALAENKCRPDHLAGLDGQLQRF